MSVEVRTHVNDVFLSVMTTSNPRDRALDLREFELGIALARANRRRPGRAIFACDSSATGRSIDS